jgi:predicted XRE-type DNA-binding protein
MTGFVYCIGEGSGRAVKVGYSADPHRRLAKIRADNVGDMKLLGMLPGNVALEAEIHRRFEYLHIRGEWFDDFGCAITDFFGPLASIEAQVVEVINLRTWMQANGLTQIDLSGALGVHSSIVSRLLAQKMRPSLDLAVRIECLTGGIIAPAFWIDGHITPTTPELAA